MFGLWPRSGKLFNVYKLLGPEPLLLANTFMCLYERPEVWLTLDGNGRICSFV